MSEKKRERINFHKYEPNNFIQPIYNSNNYGPFIILEEVPKPEDHIYYRGRKYFKIKFINTGYETIAERNAINYGKVRDNYYPTVAGVGYIGDFKGNIKGGEDYRIFDLYNAWSGILNRCYNPNSQAFPLYGAIGVSVDQRWFNFTNFLYDAQLLPNYNKKAIYRDLYQIDKDYLQSNIPKSQRIYSFSKCIWLSYYDNSVIMNRERETESGYYGVRPVGNIFRCIIGSEVYSSFTTAEAAAVCFNLLYPILKNKEFSDITIINENVPNMSLDELRTYATNKEKFDLEVVQRLSNNGVELK